MKVIARIRRVEGLFRVQGSGFTQACVQAIKKLFHPKTGKTLATLQANSETAFACRLALSHVLY